MSDDVCQVDVWDGWRNRTCRRSIKRNGMCGIHAAAVERREKNDVARAAKYAERRRLDEERAARRQELLDAEATVIRVRALADEWEALGVTSVYESAAELAQILRATLEPAARRGPVRVADESGDAL